MLIVGLKTPRSLRKPVMSARKQEGTGTPAEAGVRAVPKSNCALRVNRYLGGLGRHGGWLGIGLADVDAALEECAVFNADAGRGHVAGEGAFRADVDAIGGGDIALAPCRERRSRGH